MYAACDIAATFANRASDGEFPSRFNAIRTAVTKSELLADWFGSAADLDWYARVRELRTEWTHHATVYVVSGGDDGSPQLAVESLRRRQNPLMLPKRSLFRVQGLLDWTGRAVRVVDRFGLRVYTSFVLPKLDLDQSIWDVVLDERRVPVPDGRGGVRTSQVSIREDLRRVGLVR